MDTDIVANLKAITDMVSILNSPDQTPISSDMMKESIWERRIPLFIEGLIYLIIDYATEQHRKEPYLEILKNRAYVIDKEGNVLIRKEEKDKEGSVLNKEEVLFSPKELITLFENLKKGIYQHLFQYTKFNNPIHDERTLEDYLKQTKTFEVNIIGPGKEKEKVAEETERKTKNLFALQKEVKVQELIYAYIYWLPSNYQGIVKKTQLVNVRKNYFLTRIRHLDVDFYSLSLKEQQVFFNTWYSEYINSKEVNILQAGEMMLELEKKDSTIYPLECLTGLILLYGRILSQAKEIDYDNISLSDIDIKTYDSTEIQEAKEQVSSLQVKIDSIKRQNAKKGISTEITQAEQTRLLMLEAEKRELDKIIKEKIKSSQYEMATNNNLKMQVIIEHMQNGVVWITKEKLLVIKNTNPNTGKIIFEATVPVSSLFEIMKCIEGKLKAPKPGMN